LSENVGVVQEEISGEKIKCGSFDEAAEVTSSSYRNFECEMVCIQPSLG